MILTALLTRMCYFESFAKKMALAIVIVSYDIAETSRDLLEATLARKRSPTYTPASLAATSEH